MLINNALICFNWAGRKSCRQDQAGKTEGWKAKAEAQFRQCGSMKMETRVQVGQGGQVMGK